MPVLKLREYGTREVDELRWTGPYDMYCHQIGLFCEATLQQCSNAQYTHDDGELTWGRYMVSWRKLCSFNLKIWYQIICKSFTILYITPLVLQIIENKKGLCELFALDPSPGLSMWKICSGYMFEIWSRLLDYWLLDTALFVRLLGGSGESWRVHNEKYVFMTNVSREERRL